MAKRRIAFGLATLVVVRLVLLAIELRQGLRRQATRPDPVDPFSS